jgi:hypothetical protein
VTSRELFSLTHSSLEKKNIILELRLQELVSVLLFAQLDFSDFKKKIHVILKRMLQKRVKLFFQQQIKCKNQQCGFITPLTSF